MGAAARIQKPYRAARRVAMRAHDLLPLWPPGPSLVRGSMLGYLGRSWNSSLSGSLYFDTLDMCNLPIIVCYPFTSFISFVHLLIVYWNQILSCAIYDPSSQGHRE
jgi:hypothetical protein